MTKPKTARKLATAALFALGLLAGAPGSAYAAIALPVINEFSANMAGTDTHEYVEIFGAPNTVYSGFTILVIEGDSGSTSTGSIDDGVWSVGTTDAGGFWFTGFLANQIENGTITILLVEAFTGSVGDDLDTNNDGTFDVTPWTTVRDAVAVHDGGTSDLTYAGFAVLEVSYDGLPFAPGGASRIPDGFDADSDTDWVRNDFDLAGIPGYTGTLVEGEAFNTPGVANEAVNVPAPSALALVSLGLALIATRRIRRKASGAPSDTHQPSTTCTITPVPLATST